jgi:hypothetical protein
MTFAVVQAVKAGHGKEGSVRCTFEDKILMSDIVFLRAWTSVDVPRFFNPVTSLLQAHNSVWKGMKTSGELHRQHDLPIPVNTDSLYKVMVGVLSDDHFFTGAVRIGESVDAVCMFGWYRGSLRCFPGCMRILL